MKLPPWASSVVLLTSFAATRAWSFSETLRHDYPSCSSCHHAPLGGGALTGYGSSAAGDVLSTLRTSDDGVTSSSDYLVVSGDWRSAFIGAERAGSRVYRKILPMQAEAEVILQPVSGLTISATAGFYGEKRALEYRKAYAALAPVPWLYVRGGRFFSAFGVNDPDHTGYLRSRTGFGEGQETYNGEAVVLTRVGELAVSHSLGSSLTFLAADGLEATAQVEDETTGARLVGYLTKTARLGASAQWSKTHLRLAGAHAEWAPLPWLYTRAEAVRTEAEYLADYKIAVEPFRGLMPYFGQEFTLDAYRYRLGLQWLLVKGLEIDLRARLTVPPPGQPSTKEVSAIFHAYL